MFPVEGNKISILYEIAGLNHNGQGYFNLVSDWFSFFPKEKEILLWDGIEFDIQDIITNQKHKN